MARDSIPNSCDVLASNPIPCTISLSTETWNDQYIHGHRRHFLEQHIWGQSTSPTCLKVCDPRNGNDRSIEIADSQAISNNVGPKTAISLSSKLGDDGSLRKEIRQIRKYVRAKLYVMRFPDIFWQPEDLIRAGLGGRSFHFYDRFHISRQLSQHPSI